MAKIDRIKEEINYLKFWIGVVVAIFISIGGWIITNLSSTFDIKILLAVLFLNFLGIAVYFLHKLINKKIKELEEL